MSQKINASLPQIEVYCHLFFSMRLGHHHLFLFLLTTLAPALPFPIAATSPDPGLERFYIGTYGTSIYQSTLNPGNGTLGAFTPAGAADSASFLALTPNNRFLYAVNETAGFVLAFSVNVSTGALTFLNQQSSNGSGPAHVVVDRSGTNVFVSNYGGGSVTVFPILNNGQLGSATAHIQHPATSPHAHCTTLDRSNHF